MAYEDLVNQEELDEWPEFDEEITITCYTSGTTGNPKVFYILIGHYDSYACCG